ncbi:glycine cleavage T protein (aminomethyl transferase) [Novosphingobium nitrogenifigens DSM 19370]|uniref:Glycine cleavage T protein (Aminomethyl transferase) n=1 Tax=Novosphingobium nitrogenifigens DSM 19370 TaxID=983920 RepID=F1ZCU2_9SPHN|nr:aminomethyltransferase family protein [Novosphingobium nitrogenifigens]EGD57579.1 glycine cleavage T protein (aminomethyl transferase) [Novosphingobium nitrogenifigens DSM 19370]
MAGSPVDVAPFAALGAVGALQEERIVVEGGASVAFDLRPGDAVRIVDPEGLQQGRLDMQPVPDGPPDMLVLFEGDSPAGAEYRFVAEAALSCILAAPGEAMAPDAQNPPTELYLHITRAEPAGAVPPPPLATAKLDMRVPAADARAFRVKAGDYIQIIDVEGKQCSDFLAFDADALGQGVELGLDATVTRTLMGNSFSSPGLHSRYFDANLRPMVEVVRDTVGRHDTFLLACSAKYYDDMGYPGHANCTDNFNRALEPYGVAAKKGWPAVNFFYNTVVGEDDLITMDEPWSRPGDYVLLRALTDLVCASSSCADDIDPANAWNPTDIHVRVYDASAGFSPGSSHRMTPDAPARLTRKTGFHERTSALTRNFIDYRGFWLPTCFTNEGAIAEYWACREKAVVMDLSALRKFEVIGPDAEALMQLAVTRDITKLAVGQVVYTAMCHETGGMIDDGTVFRLGPTNFRWVCGEDWCGVWLRELAEKNGLKVWVKSSTDQLHNLALQGPLARKILAPLVTTPAHRATVEELKWFRFTTGKLGDIPVMISRTGYTGELGYEIWCHPDQGAALWDALMAAGEPYGLMPFGLDGLDMVRIEAGLVFAGYEFCDQTDPFEAGIGFAVPKAKTAPYVGSEALALRREHPQRVLVGLDVAGAEAVGHGDPVFDGRLQVGVVTSATRSPVLGKTIALARVDVRKSALGQALEIGKLDGHQKRIAASVVRFPHYDPDKTRVRA